MIAFNRLPAVSPPTGWSGPRWRSALLNAPRVATCGWHNQWLPAPRFSAHREHPFRALLLIVLKSLAMPWGPTPQGVSMRLALAGERQNRSSCSPGSL